MKKTFMAKAPWEGQGKEVVGAKTLDEVLAMTNLNFEVNKQKIYLADGTEVKDSFANVRSDNNTPLGVVGKRYEIVQNKDAFNFLDGLIDEGMEFTRGGSSSNGSRNWVLGKLDGYNLLGDEITPHLMFSNSFDGSGSVNISVCMLRRICGNGLTLIIPQSKYKWSVRHTKTANDKFNEIEKTLKQFKIYKESFVEEAEKLAQIKAPSVEEFTQFLLPLPMDFETSERVIRNTLEMRAEIENLYRYKEDIDRFRGTMYGLYLAITDYASHATPQRKTQTFEEKRMFNVVDGANLTLKSQEFFKLNA